MQALQAKHQLTKLLGIHPAIPIEVHDLQDPSQLDCQHSTLSVLLGIKPQTIEQLRRTDIAIAVLIESLKQGRHLLPHRRRNPSSQKSAALAADCQVQVLTKIGKQGTGQHKALAMLLRGQDGVQRNRNQGRQGTTHQQLNHPGGKHKSQGERRPALSWRQAPTALEQARQSRTSQTHRQAGPAGGVKNPPQGDRHQ